MHDSRLIAEPDDNLWHTEQERLRPELEQFPLVLEHVAVVADFGRGLEFDPVDGVFFAVWFAVPDCSKRCQ